MSGKDLLDAMNHIEEALIQEAEEDNLPEKQNRSFDSLPKLAAACAAILLAASAVIALAVYHGQHNDPKNQIVKVTEETMPPKIKKPEGRPAPTPAADAAESQVPLASEPPVSPVMSENPGQTKPSAGQRATQAPESDAGKNGSESTGSRQDNTGNGAGGTIRPGQSRPSGGSTGPGSSSGTPHTGSVKPTQAPSAPTKAPAVPTKPPAAPTQVPFSPDDEYLAQGGKTETPGVPSENPDGPYYPGVEPPNSDEPVVADPGPTPTPIPYEDIIPAEPAPGN